MNIGEKITQYKERLEFRNYQDFGRAAGVSGDMINEMSKKSEIKVTDIHNLIKLTKYLGISVEQLVVNDNDTPNVLEDNATTDENSNDIGILLNKLTILCDTEGSKLSGVVMSDKARQICKDSLNVLYTLVKQHL